MNELITITTGEQGTPVVSARELHAFLEVKSRFAGWITQRISDFGFVENRDYTSFSENSEKGRPTIEYALSLNMAKELAMVERTEKGKQARLYFIAKEEQLRQVLTASPTTEQALIQLMSQTNQLMAAQQQMMAELRADVEELRNAQAQLPPAPASMPPVSRPRSGQQLGLPGIPPARLESVSLRQTITRHVADYSAYQAAPLHQTYVYLYKRMFEVYSISVHRLNRQPTESMLDVLERYGQLDRLHALVVNELLYPYQ